MLKFTLHQVKIDILQMLVIPEIIIECQTDIFDDTMLPIHPIFGANFTQLTVHIQKDFM